MREYTCKNKHENIYLSDFVYIKAEAAVSTLIEEITSIY